MTTRRPSRAFAASVDVITYEFENVPTAALDLLEALRPIRPNRRALAISQDRIAEKDLPHRPRPADRALCRRRPPRPTSTPRSPRIGAARDPEDHAASAMTARARRGSWRPPTPPAALAAMQGAPAVLEGFVAFDARGLGHRRPRPRRLGRRLRPRRERPPRRHPAHHHRPRPPDARPAQRRRPARRAHPERARLCRRHGGGAVRHARRA